MQNTVAKHFYWK